jgi:hypothetical protein
MRTYIQLTHVLSHHTYNTSPQYIQRNTTQQNKITPTHIQTHARTHTSSLCIVQIFIEIYNMHDAKQQCKQQSHIIANQWSSGGGGGAGIAEPEGKTLRQGGGQILNQYSAGSSPCSSRSGKCAWQCVLVAPGLQMTHKPRS